MNEPEPDYRAFLRDLIKVCKRHKIYIHAYDEGTVSIGPEKHKTSGPYYMLIVNSKEAELGNVSSKLDLPEIKITL